INISERKKLEKERERAAERIENEVKKRTRELERQRDFTRRILDNVPANNPYTDRHYTYVLSNPNTDRIMGVGKLEGRNLFEALPGSEPTVKPVLDKVFESRQPFSASAWPLSYTIEGKPIQQYYDVTFLPVEGEDGQIEGILGLAVEVSERVMREKLQQEQLRTLRDSDRLKDEFLSVLSHELRTPLNAVMGFGSFLEDEIGGPLTAQQREFVEKILKGGERMLVLIDDLLDFARMQAGTFGISCEETDVASLIEEVVATFEPATSEKRLAVRQRIEVPHPVRLDRQRIFQVLANLVNNAIKFTPAGGWIELRAFLDGEHLVTEVADSGVGLAPEDIPKLFQPFKQLDMSLTRRTGGVGLGLSISRGIVEAHGGKITAESAGPGRGATFRFWLPTS
ncbi:MAG: ATP-binding protein, partial [Bacteroidota bacterium]